METLSPSPGLILYLTRIPDRYWTRMLDLVEAGCCSHWATVRRSDLYSKEDPYSRVLWLTRNEDPEAGSYLMSALCLAYGMKAALEARLPLDHGSVWSLVRDMYDEKVTDFSERDVDALVQTYSLGAVRNQR